MRTRKADEFNFELEDDSNDNNKPSSYKNKYI